VGGKERKEKLTGINAKFKKIVKIEKLLNLLCE